MRKMSPGTKSGRVSSPTRVISGGVMSGGLVSSPSRNCKHHNSNLTDHSTYVGPAIVSPAIYSGSHLALGGENTTDLVRRINEETRRRSDMENDKNRLYSDLELEKRKNVDRFHQNQDLLI
jgi:hypothetical protein